MSGDDRPLGLHLDDDRPLPEARCACGWVGAASLAEGHRCDLPEPDDAEQGECEVCSELALAADVVLVAHVDLPASPLHVLTWSPGRLLLPGFDADDGLILTIGVDQVPLTAAEATLVAHALLDAADRADH